MEFVFSKSETLSVEKLSVDTLSVATLSVETQPVETLTEGANPMWPDQGVTSLKSPKRDLPLLTSLVARPTDKLLSLLWPLSAVSGNGKERGGGGRGEGGAKGEGWGKRG